MLKWLRALWAWPLTLGPSITERSWRRLEFGVHFNIGRAPDCIRGIFTFNKTDKSRRGSFFCLFSIRGLGGVTNRVASRPDVNACQCIRSSLAQRQENESMRSQSVKGKLAFQNKVQEGAKLLLWFSTASRNHIQFQVHSLYEGKGQGEAKRKPM